MKQLQITLGCPKRKVGAKDHSPTKATNITNIVCLGIDSAANIYALYDCLQNPHRVTGTMYGGLYDAYKYQKKSHLGYTIRAVSVMNPGKYDNLE